MRYEEYDSLLMEQSGSISYICDIETYEMIHLTKGGIKVCGLTGPEDYLGKKCYKILQGLDEPCPFCTNNKLAEGEKYRWEHYNESLGRWFELSDTLIRLDGRPCRMEIARDVTERKEELTSLTGKLTRETIVMRCLNILTREKDLDTAVQSFLASIGEYYKANRAYIFEFDLEQELLSNTFEWCRPGVSQEIDNLQNLPLAVVSDWLDKFKSVGEFSITSLDEDLDHDTEDYRILEAQGIKSLMAAPLRMDGKIVGFLGVDDPEENFGDLALLKAVSDFVLAELEKRRLMKELEYVSYTDMLTGLQNRNQYIRLLREYSRKTPETLGVIFVDINGLKTINDTQGHNYGDYVIRQTASILKRHLDGRQFRIGGDEFVALCENISREEFEAKILELRHAYDENRDCAVSIGCVWREGEVNIDSLILQADELMYAEKQSYYSTVLQDGRSASRTGVASEVLREIEEDRFVVFYQPQVDIQNGKIVGAEALVRKKDGEGGLIPPDKFIPIYEMEGVIRHLDMHVLERACTVMREWLNQGISLRLSVNFSRVTLMEPNIVAAIQKICEEKQVPTSAITIEVTESISKMDHDQLKKLIHDLTTEGFTISLDDFGSRYSNLSILASMDFDEVKFDRTLVNELEHNRKSQVVMRNSVQMCQDLEDTYSIAEGIETQGQMELLLDYHCDYGQGYYFSKPMPLDQFNTLLQENQTEGHTLIPSEG